MSNRVVKMAGVQVDEKLHSGVAGGCRACGLSVSLLPDSGLPLQGEAAQCQATLLG